MSVLHATLAPSRLGVFEGAVAAALAGGEIDLTLAVFVRVKH